jgi:hypothetical protein
MASHWNLLMDRLATEKLTAAEGQLVHAIARNTIGWNRPGGNYLGMKKLRADAGNMDGRSFGKARDGLIAKGLLQWVPGKPGKGNRGFYQLLLDTEQKTVPERSLQTEEKTAPQRSLAGAPKDRSTASQKTALHRVRRGKPNKGKPPSGTDPFTNKTFQTQAIDAYCGAGGNLELANRRGALAQHATGLLNAGEDPNLILKVVTVLGRENDFPGNLTKRFKEFKTNGGPCKWAGYREGLTNTQLADCGCHGCHQWIEEETPAASTTA